MSVKDGVNKLEAIYTNRDAEILEKLLLVDAKVKDLKVSQANMQVDITKIKEDVVPKP